MGLRAAARSERTLEGYRWALASLRTSVGPEVEADAITSLDLQRWLEQARQTSAPATVRFKFANARPFFRWLVACGYREDNPFSKVTAPKVPTKVVETLTDDELRAMLDTCASQHWRDLRDRALIRVLADTGMRRSEVCNLLVSDLDLALGVLHVRVSKSGRGRMVPLGLKSRRDVRTYLRARQRFLSRNGLLDVPALFVSRKGEPFHPQGLFRCIRRRMAMAGVHKPRAVHAFRHTFAARALERGAGEVEVMAVAGWTSTGMLRRYAASSETARALAAHAALWGAGDRL